MVFFAYKRHYFSTFLTSTKIWQKRGPKNDNFSQFAKKGFIKTVLLQHPFFQKLVFLNLSFVKAKTMMLNKNTNQNEGKTKTRKRDLKEKTRQETKNK